jgi:hypothetical protein
MLDKEFKYFLDNKDSLTKEYHNKYIVIVGENVTHSFSSEQEAYEFAVKKYGLGNFLIQYCGENNAKMQNFHSRVSFV